MNKQNPRFADLYRFVFVAVGVVVVIVVVVVVGVVVVDVVLFGTKRHRWRNRFVLIIML